jgi:uncharacterized protein YndB with AHSA1/START domain
MITYRIEETINRPVGEVFRYVADPKLYAEWMPVSEVQVTTPGEVRVGSTARAMMKMGSRMAPFTWKITEYTANASLTFGTIEGPVNWDGTFEVSPAPGAATRIISSGRVGLKGWQRLLEPFMAGEIRRGEGAELRRLKDLLERSA